MLVKPNYMTCILESGDKAEEQALIAEYNRNRLPSQRTLENGYPLFEPSQTLKQWHRRIDTYYKRMAERINNRVVPRIPTCYTKERG